MAITAQLFDGTILEFPDGTEKSVVLEAAKRITEEKQIKPDTGFTGAFKAGTERLKGDVAALAGRTGIMNTEAAEQYREQKERLAQRMFTPTEEGFAEAPFTKFKELLGGSLPYAAAPLVAGIGAATLPVSAPAAAAIGIGGAGLASLGQFTGSNLSRQMQEDPNLRLADTSLSSAAAAAAPQAALDVVSFRMMPGIGKIFGAAGKQITPEVAQKIAEQGIIRTTGAYSAGALKTAGIEGTTEAGQQFLERLQAGLNLTDQQARDEYFDSFIGGAVLGGTLGVPGTYIERGRTIRQGAEMEEEQKRQAIVDRQNAQREAVLAQKQQLEQTAKNLGVPTTLALPAPEQRIEAQEVVDPLIDPLGRFKSTDLSAKEVAEVNRRRLEMGKPRIGRTFSIEDLADVFKPEENVAAEGVLNRLIASRTGYTADQNIPAQTLTAAAQQRGIDTTTQGFKDFLIRTTGTDNIDAMSAPQRLAVAQAIQNVKPGDETRILEAGLTNAKYYTPEQYNDTLRGLSKEFKEMGNQENGISSVLKQIEKYSGLKQEKDQLRILNQAVKDGLLERNVKLSSTGSTIETFKPATDMQPLPGGMDIRKETFKQGEVPESYELRAGARVLSARETQEEADRDAAAFEQKRQDEIVRLEKDVQKLQKAVAKRNAELTQMQALGQDQSNEFFIKSANYYGQDQVDNGSIADLRKQQQGFADPVQVFPVGTKPVTKESFTFYEKDQPQVRFDSEEQAEQYGISRLNDKTLQQIVDSAASQKQTGKVKRYNDLAQKELDERQSIETDRGIAITTTQGLEGSKERLEKMGIFSQEAKDNVEKLRQTLLPALKRFGLEKVALRLIDSIENGTADGYYVQQVIAIAMDSKDPMGTLRHESIHALKELGAFTDQEWKVLTNKAKSEYVQKYIKDTNLFDAYKERYKAENGNLSSFDEYIYEEAIAEAFRNFKPGNLPAGMIGNIWVRLNKLFEAISNGFKKLGFQTADDIFTRVEEGEQKPTKDVVAEAAPKASLRKTASLENALDFARKNDFKRNRDLKVALQDQVLAAAEKENIDLTSTDEETTEYLTKSVADDAIYALKSNANAVGWYDITVAKALNVVSLMHPEIKTDPDAKFAFTWALAVTSNGMKVDKNFELAEQAYSAYKKTGKMPTNIKAGETQKAINKSLELFNSMIDKYGINDMRKFMATEFTVKQIESLTNLKVGGEFADTRVLGAAILGPKIGNGFFSNLNGIFDQLTMDRWLMRTWGRLTGSLIEDNARLADTKRGEMERLINGLLKPSARPTRERFERITGKTITEADVASADAIDALATAVNKASIKPLNRTFFNKSQIGSLMRKTSNSLVGYIDGQKEIPAGPAERNFIREVFSGALDSVRKRGYPNMTMSDLQALLWYPERRLYDIAKESNISEGYKDDEAPDYTNAASKLVRSNGIPESKIKTVIANTEKEYENRARAVQRDAGKYPSQVGSEGRSAGFAGKERSHFITRGIIRSYRERNETSPNAYKGNGGKDGKGFRVLGQKAVAEFKPVIGFKNALAKADVNVPTFYELDPSGAVAFRKSISKVKEESPFGAAVFVYPDEEYANMRTFLTNDGKAGFALKGNDIVSVFSKEPHVGGVNGIMQLAVQEGGRRLDAFDTVLPDLYYNNGFKTVARLDWNNEFQPEGWDKETFKQFNNGQPDVVFMVYDPEYNKPPTNTDGEKINEYDQGIDEQAKAITKGAKLSFRRFEPTEPAERPSTVGGGIVLGNKQPDSSSFEGIHYSNAEQKTLNGNRYGDGIKGAEAFRLSQTDDPRIKKRVYFYIENVETGRMQPKEAGLGNYVHKQKFDNILAPSDRMTEIYRLANKDFNQFESAVIDAGYDGYAVPDMGMMVILDHNTPVNYEGTVQELAEKGVKYSLRNDLNKNGIAITSRLDAEKRFSNGERIYLFPEQDEDPFLARNISELNAYPPDSMLALPSKKLQIRAPDTKEFKEFFKGSKAVNEDGSPKLYYHGTARDITEFKPKQANAIFLTDDPEFADFFTDGSRDFMNREIFNALDIPEKERMQLEALEIAREEYGYDDAKYKQLKRDIQDLPGVSLGLVSNDITFPLRRLLSEMLPSRENIIPAFVKTVNPFDYKNPQHINAIIKKLNAVGVNGSGVPFGEVYRTDLLTGNWQSIEDGRVQAAIKDLGHDGFYVREDGRKNLAVYNPNQVKSAFNVAPTESPDIRFSLRNPAERFTDAALTDELGPKSRKIVILMPIEKFLNLAKKDSPSRDKVEGINKLISEGTKFRSIPTLLIDDSGEMPRVTGHEGRHRARALQALGYTEVPVKIVSSTIRWDNQDSPDRNDYVEDYPTKLLNEDGDYTVRYPVSRELASNYNYEGVTELPVDTTPRFSLRSQLSDRLNERIGATTTKRKQAGFVERLMDAISPTAITAIRQGLINKYESIELLSRLRGEQFGSDQLLAETSAIAAALQSDRAAGVAASSFKDGIPVYDKGYTFVSDMDGKVKGLIPILEPLMKYNDPYIFQTFQFYAGTRRGRRLDAEGREKTFTKEDIAAGKELETQFPEFATVFDDYQKYNQGLVKYMMDTGVISAEEAKIWTQNWDYIPFYRQIEGEKTAGPKVFSPIAGVAKPKKLKGSEAPLDDFMETIIRNARAAIEAGMKNEAARRVIRDVVDFDLGERLVGVHSGNDIVTVKEKGETVYYRVADPLLVESLKGLNLPQLPFMSFLSAPADLLRNFVTKDPGFILANLGRDSMQAWITSGTNMTPLVDTFKQFGKGLLNYSPEAYALARSGLTGYDFAGDVESTAKKVEKELRKRTGTRTKGEIALLPITAFWDKLGDASTASDMATRAEVYKRVLERTGSEAEAFYQAMEVINFSRKGNSAIIRILSATIPFFNARVQGLDVLYRTGFGKAAMENKDKIQKAFIFRSMVLLGTSVMYWSMVSDDEDYKKLSEEERDNYWIIPGLRVGDKPFRFPIPFELGVLFKVLPERALEYSFGTDTGKDLRKALLRNAMSTLSFNPIPQAVLPIVENVTNYSFFTGEPVIGRGVEGLAPAYQFGAGTSVLARQMGEALNYSPQKIDNFIRGYTGTIGTYAMMMLDSALEQEGDPPRAAKRMEQMPVIKRFFASNTGTVSAYYDLKEEVDTVVTTVNMLQRTGNSEDLKTYLEENKKLYGLKSYVATLDKNMKQLNQATRLINASKTMNSDEKREALDRINDAKIKLTERTKLLRKGYE